LELDQKAALKQASAEAAVKSSVGPGCRLGLGTGSTAAFAIEKVAGLYNSGKLEGLLVFPTSLSTEWACRRFGLPVTTLNDPKLKGELDVTIDGADEIDPNLNLIKGGGGALLLEKIAARAAKRFVVIADESKLQPHLGTGFPLPLEVALPAVSYVLQRLEKLGGEGRVRMGVKKAGPVITDSGNLLVDVTFEKAIDPLEMESNLLRIPGILETGLFVDFVYEAWIGGLDGNVKLISRT